ncbi:helix-turn-helix transcriptional regulator [Streptosporangium sp. NPDC002524]|uniref:helix-turn-helix transcriptional regulator n=1 Tax=Streptosporangium sp. NPDC002524 TaxID=3154537 RepID=UPI00332903CC
MPFPSSRRLTELRIQFGRRLREVREQHGLTQERLGELADVDRKTINRIENGMYSPLLDQIFKISDALEVPARELFPGADVHRERDPASDI